MPESKNPEGLVFLAKSQRLAKWLDSNYRIPGTNIKFGLDPLLGLVPIVGDAVGLFMSLALVLTMILHGTRGKVVALMITHSVVDALFGSIPIVGPFFDVWYKANNRNVRLLEAHYSEGKHDAPATSVIVGWMVVLFTIFASIVFLISWLFLEIFDLLPL
ncbi:MAG: hypothetical protein SchgKO_21110 [Schleiferiaceae bacterium]